MKTLAPWVFYPLWLGALAVFLAMWTYGEMGTLHGVTGAWIVWLLSLPLAGAVSAVLLKHTS